MKHYRALKTIEHKSEFMNYRAEKGQVFAFPGTVMQQIDPASFEEVPDEGLPAALESMRVKSKPKKPEAENED